MDQRNEAQNIAKRISELAKTEAKKLTNMQIDIETIRMNMQLEMENIQMKIEARAEFMNHLLRLAVRLEELYQESLRDKQDAH